MKIILIIAFIQAILTLRAQNLVYDYYHPIGVGENLTIQFNHSIEATTVNQYNGYLLLQFSGYGFNNPNEVFDAFYAFNESGPIFKQGVGIAFDGSTVLNGFQTLYEKDIGNNTDVNNPQNSLWQIVFNEDIGPYSGLNRGGFPIFRPDHEYSIVLFVNSVDPRTLNFGFLDGGLGDNSGQINLSLTPVGIGSVPEPTALFPISIGLALWTLLARKK